jgi:hypothetical protein
VQAFVVVASAMFIGWIALRGKLDQGRRETDILLVLLAGLAINAVIFGGLSAPVDRYQGRIIWLVPMLAGLFWLARTSSACLCTLGRPAHDVRLPDARVRRRSGL